MIAFIPWAALRDMERACASDESSSLGLANCIVSPSVIGTRSIVTYLALISPNIKLTWDRAGGRAGRGWTTTIMGSCLCQLDLRAQLVRAPESLGNDKACSGLGVVSRQWQQWKN